MADEPRRKVIGIVGGLGPYAHMILEQRILDAAAEFFKENPPESNRSMVEQDFPEWILSSIPSTPDRTKAIQGRAPDPTPWIVRSVRRLQQPKFHSDGAPLGGADFAIIACNTGHHYLDAVREQVAPFDVLDMIEETGKVVLAESGKGAMVGVLATTGTLRSRVYHKRFEDIGLRVCSLLDCDAHEERQNKYTMEPIYGPWNHERSEHEGGGIKSGIRTDAQRELLEEGAKILIEEKGAQHIIAGCTEIPIVLQGEKVGGKDLTDPMRVIASVAVAIGSWPQ